MFPGRACGREWTGSEADSDSDSMPSLITVDDDDDGWDSD